MVRGFAALIVLAVIGTTVFVAVLQRSEPSEFSEAAVTQVPAFEEVVEVAEAASRVAPDELVIAPEPAIEDEVLVSAELSDADANRQVTTDSTQTQAIVPAESTSPIPDPSSVEMLEARLLASTQTVSDDAPVVLATQDSDVASESSVAVVEDVSEPWRPEAADYLYQWELPLSVRQSLPTLKLVVHVYSNKPEERFVLINGTRYREGDELARGARLAEIRPQGALVDFRDYRFLLTQ